MDITAAKPVKGHPGFATYSFKQVVGLRPQPRTITVLTYNGVKVDQGSRSDVLAVLNHEPTRARYIVAATK